MLLESQETDRWIRSQVIRSFESLLKMAIQLVLEQYMRYALSGVFLLYPRTGAAVAQDYALANANADAG